MIHGDRAVKGLMPLISTRAKEKSGPTVIERLGFNACPFQTAFF